MFMINFDDSDINSDELFDTDIREFYNFNCLIPQMWNEDELNSPDILKRYLGEKLNNIEIHTCRLSIWSKFIIDHEWDDAVILEKAESRFCKVLPNDRLNLIIIYSLHPPKQLNENEIIEEKNQKLNDKPSN